MTTKRTRFWALSAASLALALSGCMGAGGSIPSASAPITQTEAQQGAQYHPQLVAEFGGEVQGPLADYVERIGKDMVVQSGNSRDSFNVSLLDSSINNAFAVPGGYIYSTRQLISLMDNEAELAAVMGHEVGHVVARHSARRQARAQRNTILGGLGAILSSVFLGNSEIGNVLTRGALQAPQFLTLAHSREQEEEADRLGIDYISGGGYDPRAMATLLERLAAQVELDARLQGRENARPPVWASTHPEPVARVRLANAYASDKPGNILNRDRFLSQIDGMIYGDNPRQGVIEGNAFIHPDLRLTFEAPQGYYMINSTRAVSVNGQGGQAQLTLAPYNGDLDSYVRQQFREVGGENNSLAPQSIERTTVNGLRAAYGTARANNNGSQVDVVIFAYEFASDRAYHFMAVTPAGRSNTFGSMFQSMRRISASEAAQVIPRVIDVVTVQRGDTVSGLARRMAFDTAREERFRVLNGLGPNDGLIAGRKVKLVVRGR
ncbi:MAG: M48 family metalloprotease [Pseudomonadota bacterium]